MAVDTSYYSPAEQYQGKTLSQLSGSLNFRPDILASFLGISPNAPLSANTSYQFSNLPENYRGESGEGNAFRSIFSAPGMSPEMRAIQPAVSSLQASIPEISQKYGTERTRLESEKDPLKQRYQTVLDELKRRETRDVGEINTALAREYGRRGIPLSSGLYEETGIEKRRPVSEFYGIQGREAGATLEENLRNITNLISGLTPQEVGAQRDIKNIIAQLQAGAGKDTIANAMQMLQFQEGQRQYNQNLALQQAQQALAERELGEYKIPSLQGKQTDPYNQFLKLGEGETLFDLSRLQQIFKNPKTYKAGSGDEDSY